MSNKFLKVSFSSVAVTQLASMLPANNVGADGLWAWLCELLTTYLIFWKKNEQTAKSRWGEQPKYNAKALDEKNKLSAHDHNIKVLDKMKERFEKFKKIKFFDRYSGEFDFGEYKLPFSLRTEKYSDYFMGKNCLAYELCIDKSSIISVCDKDLDIGDNLEKKLEEAYKRLENWYESVCLDLKKIDKLVKAGKLYIKSFNKEDGELLLGTKIRLYRKDVFCNLLKYDFNLGCIIFIVGNDCGEGVGEPDSAGSTYFRLNGCILDSMLSEKNDKEGFFNGNFEFVGS